MHSSPKAPPDLAWVYVSAAAFFCALIAAGLFIAFADRLAFISNAVYYIVLMPIALASAAFLFGAMRSHARYKGSSPKGTLQLGGPVVVFHSPNPDSTGVHFAHRGARVVHARAELGWR